MPHIFLIDNFNQVTLIEKNSPFNCFKIYHKRKSLFPDCRLSFDLCMTISKNTVVRLRPDWEDPRHQKGGYQCLHLQSENRGADHHPQLRTLSHDSSICKEIQFTFICL